MNATPGTPCSWYRMVQSATDRSSIGSTPSPTTANSNTSPMREETGPRRGRVVFSGSRPVMSSSLLETS